MKKKKSLKDEMMRIAGTKTEKEFYRLYPDEASFMKKYGGKIKKLQAGGGFTPLTTFGYNSEYDDWLWSNVSYDRDPNFNPTRLPSIEPKRMPTTIDSGGEKLASMKTKSVPTKPDYGQYLEQGLPIIGDVIKGLQMLKDEKKELSKAGQEKEVTDVMLQASRTTPEKQERKYLRPEDFINTGDEFYPTYGVGTNILAKYGRKIPYAEGGSAIPWDIIGEQGSDILTGVMGEDGGGTIGGSLGKGIGKLTGIPGAGAIGGLAGQAIGSLLDTRPERIKKQRRLTALNVGNMALGRGVNDVFSRNRAFMETGGEITPISPVVAQPIKQELITMPSVFDPTRKYGKKSNTYLEESKRIDKEINTLKSKKKLSMKDKTKLRELGLMREDLMSHQLSTMKSGGNISPDMEMKGELQLLEGDVKPMSYNPYLPDGGETVMFQGPSHEKGGMVAAYGNNSVEVEGGETATKLRNGGSMDEDLVVWGDLKAPGYNKKFKNVVKDISKKEERENNLIDRSIESLDSIDVITPIDKLSFNSHKTNLKGANVKLMGYAEEKQKLASLQDAINETADELNLDTDALAKGKIIKSQSRKKNTAKSGTSIPKAAEGGQWMDLIKKHFPEEEWDNAYKIMMIESRGKADAIRNEDMNPGGGRDTGLFQINSKWQPQAYEGGNLLDPEYNIRAAAEIYRREGWKPWKASVKKAGIQLGDIYSPSLSFVDKYPQKTMLPSDLYEKPISDFYNRYTSINDKKDDMSISKNGINIQPLSKILDPNRIYTDYLISKIGNSTDNESDNITEVPIVDIDIEEPEITDRPTPTRPFVFSPAKYTTSEKEEEPSRLKQILDAVGSYLPYFTPSDADQLDMRQIYPELSTLAEHAEPVQAQTFQPELGTPYQVSLQDQLNEITAQERSAMRLAGDNPAAQAIIAAQSQQAKSKVLGEQFRINQAMAEKTYAENRNAINQAKLQNLALLDKEYERQETAKSKTKEARRAALSSISEKYMRNQLENRQLATFENLYGYRFDPRYRAWNYNAPARFNTEGTSDAYTGGTEDPNRVYRYERDPETGGEYVVGSRKKPKSRYGNIVKAIKNI